MKILVVDDDPVAAFALLSLIEDLGHSVELADDGLHALRHLEAAHFDVVFSDWMMPGIDGIELCRRLRDRQTGPYVYVILVTSRDASEDRWKGLEAGADDFLIKPADLGDVRARLIVAQRILAMQAKLRETMQNLEAAYVELGKANSQLHTLASTDGLTDINNHRSFQDRLRQLTAAAIRTSTPLSLLILDLDNFKAYNDTFGHPAGDEVLKRIARILGDEARDSDHVARYGGEEFVVILPDTGEDAARAAGERFRAAIEAADWRLRTITASIGVSTLEGPSMDPASMIEQADRALYASKKAGRNCVVHANNIL